MTFGVRTKFILVAIGILIFTIGLAAYTSSHVFTKEYSKALQAKTFVVGENLRNQLDKLLNMGIPIHELVGFDKQCEDVVNQYDDLAYAKVVDLDGRVLFHEWDIQSGNLKWFGNADEQLGYASGQLPRTFQDWASMTHPDDRQQLMQAIEEHIESRQPFYQEYRIRHREGHYLYWTDRGTALWDNENQPYRFIGVTTDITHRRMAEGALRESERRYRELADLLPQPVYETDAKGNLSFANCASFNSF